MPGERKDECDYLPDANGQQTTKELKQAENKGFEKSKRLLNSHQYKHVLGQGKSYRNPLFVMVSLPNVEMTGRIGIIVSKKVSKQAVDRNRLKRLVRESFRKVQTRLPKQDIVIIARRAAVKANNKAVHEALTEMWQKLI